MINAIFDPFYYTEGRHMLHKGGGAPSTGGLEKATREATALQREQYEQGREDLQPWYKTGSAGMGKLADLLGLSGGSVMGRQDIYDELLPQYTTRTAGDGAAEMWSGKGGQLFSDAGTAQKTFMDDGRRTGRATLFSPAQEAQDVIDYTGLNAALDERMLAQQETPEGFGSLLQQFGAEQFEASPGYQFRQDEAQKALERGMSAQGVTLGGGGFGTINPQVARAMQEQSQGLASQEFGQAFNRYNIGQENVYNRLMGVAGMGQGSASQMVGAGQQMATNIGQLGTGLAQAQYEAELASQKDSGSMFGTIAGGLAGAALGGPMGASAGASIGGAAFSDERLKDNVELVGHEMGHNIYEFDYKDGSGRFRGVLAQEVQDKEPGAVIEHSNGFLMVDYDKLGLKMEKVNGV